MSRYIDTAFADKGSHKKNLQPKYSDTSKFGLLGTGGIFKVGGLIGAGDAMATMAMAMARIWKAHEPVIPGHHNR